MRHTATAVALLVVLLASCENPASARQPESLSIQIVFSDEQLLGGEVSLIKSGVVWLQNGGSNRKFELRATSTNSWEVTVDGALDGATSVKVQLFSGQGHSGLLLFAGATTLGSKSSGEQLVSVSSVSHVQEKFSRFVSTTTGVEVFQFDDGTTVIFYFDIKNYIELEISDSGYSEYQTAIRQDTFTIEKRPLFSGTVVRQGLVYAVQRQKKYDDNGNETPLLPEENFEMDLSVEGDYLVPRGFPSEKFLRQ